MPKITIIASQCNQANGDLSPAEDKFNGFHAPYLSLVTPALRDQGFEVDICAWNRPLRKPLLS